MQTIILEDFGVFLGKKSERFVIKKKGKTLAEYPASQVERIIVSSSGASLSSSALYLAVTNRIPVSFTYSSGRPFGFLTPTLSHGTVLTRRAQYEQSGTLVATNLAKGFILGKLSNQKGLLKGWAKSRTRTDINLANRLFDLANDLDQAIEKIEIVDGALDDITRLTIMNIEGIAAASYWKGVSMILPTELGFESRVTRGATDSFNMLLNYGYGILYSEVWSAVSTAGLDPFAGFLHVDRPGRPSLVLDLIEEFRQQIVDRSLVTALVRKKLNPQTITADEEGLSKDAKGATATAVIERLEERVTVESKKIPLKNVITKQAWKVAKVLRGETKRYAPFFLSW